MNRNHPYMTLHALERDENPQITRSIYQTLISETPPESSHRVQEEAQEAQAKQKQPQIRAPALTFDNEAEMENARNRLKARKKELEEKLKTTFEFSDDQLAHDDKLTADDFLSMFKDTVSQKTISLLSVRHELAKVKAELQYIALDGAVYTPRKRRKSVERTRVSINPLTHIYDFAWSSLPESAATSSRADPSEAAAEPPLSSNRSNDGNPELSVSTSPHSETAGSFATPVVVPDEGGTFDMSHFERDVYGGLPPPV